MEEEFIIGIKVLAAVHAGLITWTCSVCENDPQKKKQLACDDVSEFLVWQNSDIGEFYSCPLRWITQPVLEWYDEYLYLKEFPGVAPKYGEFNKLFWEACKLYQGSYNKYHLGELKKQSSSKSDTTSKSLGSLRKGFNERKK